MCKPSQRLPLASHQEYEMNTKRETSTASKIELSIIALIAALMGVGQNGLLVSLPFLVEHSAFNLPTWSVIIAIGSFLFLPAAPFWGRYSDRNGPKVVVIQSLLGMSVSFLLLLVFTALSGRYTDMAWWWLAGLVVARIIYGCTVAGMVPASQHWAVLLCGADNRLQAITSVSVGLSCGRLIGPLLAIGALKIHLFAPLVIMVLFPAMALIVALYLPIPNAEHNQKYSPKASWLPKHQLWPFLASGMLLCATIALLQYNFSPLIISVTQWNLDKVSDAIGVLLTVSAALTLCTQLLVIKKSKMTIERMYRVGAVMLLLGLVLFLIPQVYWFLLAMSAVAIGAALLVPAYTTMATQSDDANSGAIAGYISMSHTIGYGGASLLAYLSLYSPRYPIWLCIAFAVLVIILSWRPPR